MAHCTGLTVEEYPIVDRRGASEVFVTRQAFALGRR